jgi:hypothetical protein
MDAENKKLSERLESISEVCRRWHANKFDADVGMRLVEWILDTDRREDSMREHTAYFGV